MLSKFQFTLIIFMMAVPMAATDVFLPALPTITQDLHVSNTFGSMIVTIFMIGYGLGQMVFGPISDNIGRKPVLIFCLVVTGITSFIIIFIPSHYILLMRFIQGASSGGVTVLGPAMVSDTEKDQKSLSSKLSFMFAVILMGPVIMPLFGGVLLTFMSWRYLFGITAAYTIIILLMAFLLKPEQKKIPKSISIKHIFAGYPKVLGNMPVMGFTVAVSLIFTMIVIYLFNFAITFQNFYHFSLQKSSLMLGSVAISAAISNIVSGILLKLPKTKPIHLLMTGYTIGIIGVIVGSLFMHSNLLHNPYAYLSANIILFFSTGFIFSSIFGFIMMPFAEFAGTVTGIIGVIETIFGSLLATWIAATFRIEPTIFFGIIGILIVISALLSGISYRAIIKDIPASS